jgi:hypothetical protein
MLGWIKQLFAGPSTTPKPQTGGRLEPESRFVVSFGDQRIVCRRPNDTEESVTWDDLNAVIIETNDTGPLDTDVCWILLGQGAKKRLPHPRRRNRRKGTARTPSEVAGV